MPRGHGGTARRKRGQRLAQNQQAAATWERAHADEETVEFAKDILPGMEYISLKAMMAATGLSLRYCWLIRRGERIPHRRHWEALRSLGDADSSPH